MAALASTARIQSLPRAAEGFVVEPGSDRVGGRLYVVGMDMSVKISSRDTGGAFAVIEDCTPPMAGPPLHLHREQDEWWYIAEGEYLFEVDGKQFNAPAGSTVFAPRGSRHAFKNVGATPARAIVTVVPGGLDLFFEDLNAAVPRGTAPDPAILAPIFDKHGLELLGPPLAATSRA